MLKQKVEYHVNKVFGMAVSTERIRYGIFLSLLVLCGLLLASRLLYLFLSDAQRFPINTVKISASYQHITRKQLESILSSYLSQSFFGMSINELKADLEAMPWAHQAVIKRVWPDTLSITLNERIPFAVWNDALITQDGMILPVESESMFIDTQLPHLKGPTEQQKDVLQIYQKLGKILTIYGLHAASLQLRDNQAWDMSLTNGIQIHLGKRDLEERLERFCRSYPAVFSDKSERLLSVDLRYASGMAVEWKGKSNNKREDNG